MNVLSKPRLCGNAAVSRPPKAFGGRETAALPHNRGFDKTFILDATGGNNFNHHSYLPYYSESPWFKNGQETELPKDFYSSEFFVDQMIEFIDEDITDEASSVMSSSMNSII